MIKPYQKITTIDLWTDEYISNNLLKSHLNTSNDLASRNGETIRKTVDFITKIVETNKSICDFGCGPGLYTDLLEQRGYKVTGIDISRNSIDYAKKTNSRVRYVNENYIDYKFKEKFDFLMMIYCDFGALDKKSQVKVLGNISSVLETNGLFMFDVMSYKHFNDSKVTLYEFDEYDGFYMKGNCHIKVELIKYPELGLILTHHKAIGHKEVEFFNWDKCYDIEEMKVLLEENGFEITDVYSNTYGGKEYLDSSSLTFICRKKSLD